MLVHCRGGRSRSATIVIAYLMRTFNWSLQQAYDFVQARNPKISPNLGFMGQLINFENRLRMGGHGQEPPSRLSFHEEGRRSAERARSPNLEVLSPVASVSS